MSRGLSVAGCVTLVVALMIMFMGPGLSGMGSVLCVYGSAGVLPWSFEIGCSSYLSGRGDDLYLMVA